MRKKLKEKSRAKKKNLEEIKLKNPKNTRFEKELQTRINELNGDYTSFKFLFKR